MVEEGLLLRVVLALVIPANDDYIEKETQGNAGVSSSVVH